LRDRVKPHKEWLRLVAAAGLGYGALAAVSRTAPAGESNWTGGDGALVGAIGAIILILAYAAFEALDAGVSDAALLSLVDEDELPAIRSEAGLSAEELSAA
jgi:peptidoglycan/LPS O-acetylase OafA/YrhL